MVINQEGALQQSERGYDKRVAGVISGAGAYKSGLVLDRQQSQDKRMPDTSITGSLSPDSVVGPLTVEVDGEKEIFYFLPQEEDRVA